MKKIINIIPFLFVAFSLTSFIQMPQSKDAPIATYQVGTSKIIVWENKRNDGSIWKNFQVEKMYKKGDEWKTTNYFNQTELLELKAAINEAINQEVVIKK